MIYECPRCNRMSLAWDARCGVFLCLGRECNHVVEPPPVLDVKRRITTGTASVLPTWIQSQSERTKP